MYALIVEGWIIVDSSLGAGTEKVLRKSDSHEDRKTEKALQAFRTRFLETQATLRGVNTQVSLYPRALREAVATGRSFPRSYVLLAPCAPCAPRILALQIAMASLDFQVRGPWPKARYEQMLSTQMRMIESLAQLAGALSTLQTTWRRKFVRYSAILNPNTIADISATFALLAQSLKTGTPLPHAAGNLLLERTVRK